MYRERLLYYAGMIVVIIAGGSGTRLWPLSTPAYPKHLLELAQTGSLLQNTVKRAKSFAETSKIFIISENSHIEHVYEQLDDFPKENIFPEPVRRGTASCVAWGLAELKKRNLRNEPIAFIWADHLIRDGAGFAADMLFAGEVSSQLKKIVFVGVEPSYASTGMGYMRKGQAKKEWQRVYELDKFVEKPDQVNAERYVESGEYLWNMGYLVGTLETFEREMSHSAPEMLRRYQILCDSKSIKEDYMRFESVAVEYIFSELITNGLVISGSFDWVDVGSFKDLHQVSKKDSEGNYTRGDMIFADAISNSYICNDLGLPIAVINLDGVVVVATKDGILVSNKNHSQKVGEVSKKINGR